MVRNSGFTLLELMVAVAVAAILLTLGIPSFTSSVKSNQGVTDANSMLNLLTLARGEAIKRGGTVTLCPSNDGSVCDTSVSATWNEGYVLKSGSAVIKADVPLSSASNMTGVSGLAINFNSLGGASYTSGTAFPSLGATISVLPKNQTAFGRCVVVFANGRASVKSLPCT